MSGVTFMSQRMAAMPSRARVAVRYACGAVHANSLGSGLRIANPWDRGTTGFTAKRPPGTWGAVRP
jgi:hypothetical protein